jgi:hypothetical protein
MSNEIDKMLELGYIKQCPKCREKGLLPKPATLEYFGKHSGEKDGLQPYCRECDKEYQEKRMELKRLKKGTGEKYCGGCGKVKPIDEFNKNISNKNDGRQDRCRTCQRELNQKYLKNKSSNKEQSPESTIAIQGVEMKARNERELPYRGGWLDKLEKDFKAYEENVKAMERENDRLREQLKKAEQTGGLPEQEQLKRLYHHWNEMNKVGLEIREIERQKKKEGIPYSVQQDGTIRIGTDH